MDVEQLRQRIRERLDRGELPRERQDRTWDGHGIGLPCDGCREAIDRDKLEIELQFLSETGFRSVSFHTLCFALWDLHRREA